MNDAPSLPPRPYHHGDLRSALLRVAEEILERDGIQALTLRAAARAAGVSHAAPANHFGDLTGLLSDLAAEGFGRFGQALLKAMEAAGDDHGARMTAMGRAYVAFARAHPGLFTLMFRSERLDMTRPNLKEAAEAARQALRDAVLRQSGASPTPQRITAQAAAYWSLVHGFAVLLLDGRLDGLIQAMPDRQPQTLLDAMLAAVTVA